MEIKTVGIACDHAGYALKKFVVEFLLRITEHTAI